MSWGSGLSRAAGPELVLMDSCVDPGHPEFTVTLNLEGDALLPSSLRTVIYFDAALMMPLKKGKREAVEAGPFLGSIQPIFYFEVDPQAGSIELVYNIQGRRPVPAIPAGSIARLHFKLQNLAPENGILRLDIDAGETISLDGNGRQTFTTTAGPAYIWIGRTGPRIQVHGDGKHTVVEASGNLVRKKAWLLRGRLGELRKRGRTGRLGHLDLLPTGTTSLTGEDDEIPEIGGAFFYIAAQPDSIGRPLLGFGSDCRARVLTP